MSNSLAETTKFFSDPALDMVATAIVELDYQHVQDLVAADQRIRSAFRRRWEIGRLVFDNHELILRECGSQKAFAEGFGYSEAVISNNLRGYRALYDLGCKSWDDVTRRLEDKKINPTVQNFERLPALLAGVTSPKDTRKYDERRLEQIEAEIETIIARNESANHNEIPVIAKDLAERLEQVKTHIVKLDPIKYVWKNEKYLEFVRRLGYDAITGAPCDKPDPHHTLPDGRSAAGGKVADVWTIPVSRDTHDLIEQGMLVPSREEILTALVNTMALFIMNHLPTQK